MTFTPRQHRRRLYLRPPAGFTLVEMVMAVGIGSILLVACASVLTIATRAMNNSAQGSAAQAVVARSAVDQMACDLKLALGFTENTATAVTFTVPDRTGDNVPETIRYAWSGVAGAPLTYQFNGGTPVNLAANVQSLKLAYVNRTIGTVPPVESAEQLLMAHNGGTGSNIHTYNETTSAWQSQYFNPRPPAGSLSYNITRVRLLVARRSGRSGTLTLSIRAADAAFKPTGSALASVTLDITTIPTTATWTDFTLSPALGSLDPTKGYCVVLAGSVFSTFEYTSYDVSSTDVDMDYGTSTNGGSTWSTPSGSNALQYYVYGTVTSPG